MKRARNSPFMPVKGRNYALIQKDGFLIEARMCLGRWVAGVKNCHRCILHCKQAQTQTGVTSPST
jgi:hypothetical protein